jgi:uncharacterized protein (TIGR00645 family)
MADGTKMLRPGWQPGIGVERVLLASRWLLAPVYLGMALGLLLLVAKFVLELVHTIPDVATLPTGKLIVEVLSLIDISLAANLLLMVMLGGYENFVARLDVSGRYRPHWLDGLGFSALKLKLISSIVAIAAVSMLETFLNVQSENWQQVLLQLAILLGFGVIGMLLVLIDRLSVENH